VPLSVITMSGSSDHDRPEQMITLTGMRSEGERGEDDVEGFRDVLNAVREYGEDQSREECVLTNSSTKEATIAQVGVSGSSRRLLGLSEQGKIFRPIVGQVVDGPSWLLGRSH
jgi:hypothetical protein